MGVWADKREREAKEAVMEIMSLNPYIAPDPAFQNDVLTKDALTALFNEAMFDLSDQWPYKWARQFNQLPDKWHREKQK